MAAPLLCCLILSLICLRNGLSPMHFPTAGVGVIQYWQMLKGNRQRTLRAACCSPECPMLIWGVKPCHLHTPWAHEEGEVEQEGEGCRAMIPWSCSWRGSTKGPHKALQFCLHAACPAPCALHIAKSPADVTESHVLRPQHRLPPLTAPTWTQACVIHFLFSLPKALWPWVIYAQGAGGTFLSILSYWRNKNRSEPLQCCLHKGKRKQPVTPASSSKVLQEAAKNRATPTFPSCLWHSHSFHIPLASPFPCGGLASRPGVTASPSCLHSPRSFEVQAAPSHPAASKHFPCPLYLSLKGEVGQVPVTISP